MRLFLGRILSGAQRHKGWGRNFLSTRHGLRAKLGLMFLIRIYGGALMNMLNLSFYKYGTPLGFNI
jgi:hypothetical protein